jgi:parallel beta-helix repeat protein
MRTAIVAVASLLIGLDLQGATTSVSTGPQLQTAIAGAANGDTILLNDGTYTVTSSPGGVAFDILKSVTIRSVNGASHVTLSAAGIYIAVRIGTNNVTLDGVTISGPTGFGIDVVDWTNANGGTLSGVVLRNLAISTAALPAGASAQGISFTATNSAIELCTVSNTDGHAISVSHTTWSLIINNTIQNTGGNGIGIPLTQSDHNVISGNNLSNIGADGILLDSSQYNYVALNTITAPHNGVTLSDNQNTARHAIRNYVGNNVMVLNNKNGSDGIWINNDSDWNMAFANDATGAYENGLALFNSIGNYIRGNIFHSNPQGGIFLLTNGGTVPVNNSIQRNYLHDHGSNAGVITTNAGATDVGFNYIAGNPAQIATPIGGFLIQGTANVKMYGNLVRDFYEGENIDAATTASSLYLNRFLNVLNHYTFTGATVTWDSGSTVLGGNFFSDFTTTNGNPSNGATPYTKIIDNNNVSGNTGVYQDRYPYQSETLGKVYGITVNTPASGTSAAIGSQKTISWTSQGCVLVDVTLLDASNNPTSIVTNFADFGYYRWTVPAVATGAYSIQVSCKNSLSGATGTNTVGPRFNITSADLVLLSPQTDQIVDPTQSMLISWKKSANVTQPVTVNIRYSDGAAYSVLQSGVTNDFVFVPVSGSASNKVSIQIVSGSFADSTDGWLTIRNGNGQFTSPAAAATLYVGTPYPLEWFGPPGSDYVNIDLVNGGSTKNIVTGLADFGKYVVLTPDFQGSNEFFRLTFFNSSGTNLGTAQSAAMNVQPGTGFSASQPTPTTPTVFIDSPAAGSLVTGVINVSGWAVNSAATVGTPITNVQVTVDGATVGSAVYGGSRPDVCNIYPGRPGCPNVGYSFSLNTASLTPGNHLLTVWATNSDVPAHVGYASVTINVGIQPPTVWIDSPSKGSTVSGTILVSGWALDNNLMVGTAISAVQVKVDNAAPVTATYGINRADVCNLLPGRPGCPNVGYSLAVNTLSLSAGQHTITVTALDSDGFTDLGSATVTVTVNNSAPTVWIDSPAAKATVSGTVTVSGWALDNLSATGTAITGVQVLVDGAAVGSATYGTARADVCNLLPGRPGCPNVGYTFALNTSSWSAGPHVITVSATDSDGIGEVGLATVTVSTVVGATPPVVWIDTPVAGATVSGPVTVSGWALDNLSAVGTAISSVQVLVDGAVVGNATYGTSRPDVCNILPGRPGCPNVGYTFTLNSGTLTLGPHTITVKATDSDGTPDAGVASATVTIQTAPATVWIDQPVQGATVSGTVTVSGWAINNLSTVGTAISGVQVLVDGVLVGNATYGTARADVCNILPGRPGCPNVGYTFALNTGGLSPGQHVITVTALDSDKVPESGSASVTVTVNNGPPVVWIDQPVAGATISGTITVSGWAVDNGTVVGTAIGSVQVKVDGALMGTATYGANRADVCAIYVGRPGCPNVGYSFALNTSGLSSGVHILTVTATDGNGSADVGNASVMVIK